MNGKAIFYILLIAFLLFQFSLINAQNVSAEFISSVLPQKLNSGEQVKDGVQNLFLQGNKLYVANIWAGLQILDVSDVNNPKELGKYELTKRTRNVYVEGNYAYLSVEIEGVYIFDISDPAKIKLVSKIVTPTSEAYWVVAKFPNVYIAEGPEGVSIYNIRQPERPRIASTFDTQGWAWGLFLDRSDLYVADKSAGMVILDISNPGSPKKRGQFLGMKNAKTIQIENGLAYVANGPDGMWILDVANPELPSLVSKVNVNGYVFHASKYGNSAFLSNEISKQLEIIDVTDPLNPGKLGTYSTDGKVYFSIKQDVYVYVAADNQTLILRQNFKPVISEIENQTTDENTLLSVLPNAYDPDGDEIYFLVDNLPEGATFDSLSGLLSWTPNYEQSGRNPGVKITAIERTGSRLSSNAVFEIAVTHVNRNPSLPDVEDFQVDENSLITFNIPEGSDPDIEDKGLLTYQAQGMPEGAVFDADRRVFSWTPTFEQSGVYTVDFAVLDPVGGVDRNASIITVNHIDRKPTLDPIADQTGKENELLTFTLTGNDPDQEDQAALSYKAENLPQGAQFDPTSATFSWTPSFDQSGSFANVLFTFTAGAMSDSINVNIAVIHVNRPPVLDAITDRTVDENKLLKVQISGSDPDVEDNGKLIFSAENLPVGAQFNSDSLSFSWVPSFEQSGTYENVTFKVTDPSGMVNTRSIAISVNHVNRVPVLVAVEPKVVNEKQPLTFALVGTDPDQEDEGVLAYTAEGLPPGAILQGSNITWTPTFEQSGSYPVSFTVSDGRLSDTKSTIITVNHINRSPALEAVAAQTVDENSTLNFSLKGSDPDKEDEGKWKISAQGLPLGAQFDSTSANFSWTPTYEQSGSYQVSFKNTDPAGLEAEQQVSITVNHVNRTPVFGEQPAQVVDENSPLTFNLIPATDPDREDEANITYQVSDLPTGATFDAENLVFSWTPTFEQSGAYTANFTVSDGEFTVNQPLNITVNHINRPPVVEVIADQTTNENQPWTFTVIYSDPDNEDEGKLVLSADNIPEGASFDATSAVFNWTPTYDQSGMFQNVAVKVTDPSGLADIKTFNVTVNHVNRAPSLEAVAAITEVENTSVSFTLVGTDPDEEDAGKLSYSSNNLPAGALLDSQTGTFQWTPTFLQSGAYTVNFEVADVEGLSTEQNAVLTINDVNRTPALNSVSVKTVNENEALSFTLVGSDVDSDNTLSFTAENLPAGASLDASSGSFQWTPGYDQAGEYNIKFNFSDGSETVSQSTTITVNNVNREPTITGPGSEEVETGSSIRLKFDGNDPDDDPLTFEAGNLPSGANFDSQSGELTWTPGDDQAGDYAIVVKVTDGTVEASMRSSIKVKAKPLSEPTITPSDTSGTE